MKVSKYFSLPVEFVENKTFSIDDSLIPVDIKVMHDGLNINNTTFFDDAIEDAKETLKNKPILGYIKKKDGTDEKDFSGHEIEISFDEDGIKVIYLERPLGMVPETNNYSIIEEDGKKFVFCRGYLWKEYLNDGYEILKDNPQKSVSMEIAVDDYDINEDGSINIKKYRYLGITILGDDIQPAMIGAQLNVVGQFSKEENEDFYSKIEDLNNKISQYFTNNQAKNKVEGGENVEKNNFEEEVIENVEGISKETEERTEIEKIEEVEETTDETFEEGATEKFIKQFELSHNDIRSKLYQLLNKAEEEDEEQYYINEVFDTYFIYSSWDTFKHFKQGYIKTDVDVAFEGERIEVFAEYLTAEELKELNEMRENYSLILKENDELKEFKAQIELQNKLSEIEQVFEKYSALLNKEDYSDLQEKALDFNIKELEKELSFRVVQKKFNFSKTNKKDTTKVIIKDTGTEKDPYGSASVYFRK